MTTTLLVVVVAIALIFDFVNGFHDAANSIATIVATRVLKPWQAVIWAAFFNFISFLILPLTVANPKPAAWTPPSAEELKKADAAGKQGKQQNKKKKK